MSDPRAKKDVADLLDLADAIRDVLGMAPLRGEPAVLPEAERFFARHELPARSRGTGIK